MDIDKEVCWIEAPSGQRGRPKRYSDAAQQCVLTLKALYRLPLRAAQEMTRSLLHLLELPWPTPHDSTVSKRQANLTVSIGQPRYPPHEESAGIHHCVGFFSYRLADHFATNWQGAAIWRYREGGKAHFSVSRRHRFPTMFERYASRFGGALSNPTLNPEYALNYELGVSEQILPGLRADVAIFYNKVEDSINSVNVQHMGGTYTQFRNTGKATFRGFEIGLQGTVSPRLEWGGNYTYISIDLDDPNDPNVRLTTTPRHKAFLYQGFRTRIE